MGGVSDGGSTRRAPDTKANAALSLGLISVFFNLFFVPGILAIILGRRNRRTNAKARAGFACGIAGTVLWALIIVAALIAGNATYGTQLVSTLRVGDCIDGDLVDKGFKVTSCDIAHDAEILGKLEFEAAPGAPYPGNDAADTYQNERCARLFAEYVGNDYEMSELNGIVFGPNSSEWKRGARQFVCSAGGPDGKKLVGTVRRSGR